MPSILIYEVECQLDPDIVADYDAWLPGHVQDVLACPGFLGATIESPETPPGEPQRRMIRYRVENAAALDHYLENRATALRTETAQRFGARVRCVRRVLKPRHDLLTAELEPRTCLDCGAAVTGKHCDQCGQSAGVHVLSMREVAGDVTHSLLHLDSRVWRTLKLLIRRPGELTREFIAGRHQRYLPPFRLYLAISILFFALATLLPDSPLDGTGTGDDSASAPIAAEGRDKAPATAQAALDELSAEMRRELAEAEIDARETGDAAAAADSCTVDLPPAFGVNWNDSLERACLKIRADGGAALAERFAATAPKLMFLFLPLMAAVALLFYWRPRRLYAEHLVLFLHNHAFAFLLILVAQILNAIALLSPPLVGVVEFVSFLLLLYLFYYIFRSMRVVYGEGRLKTALKFIPLLSIYFLLLGITMMAGLAYSVLSLS